MEATMAIVSTLGNVGQSRGSAGVGARLLQALLTFEAWSERHRQRRALLDLDEHMLRDIGLSHADVASEAGKRFWQR
jgi:uncharacterized protein YjiS (DUF1127 family)